MAKCSQCESTGKIGDDYCTCADGKLQRTLERSRKTAERKRAAESRKLDIEKEKARTAKQEQLELFHREKGSIEISGACKVGDWVEVTQGSYKGVVGTVFEVEADNRIVKIDAFKHRDGGMANGRAGINARFIKVLPISDNEDDLLQLIDIALAMKDKKWFEELTNKLP